VIVIFYLSSLADSVCDFFHNRREQTILQLTKAMRSGDGEVAAGALWLGEDKLTQAPAMSNADL